MIDKKTIPKGWKVVISSEILDIRDGTHDTPKYVSEDGIPLITSKNLKNNKIDFKRVSYISLKDHLEISKRSKVEEGDILFAMIGTIGNPAIIKGDANFSIKNVGLFKKNKKVILSPFLAYYLTSRTFEYQLNERKLLKGTTQKFIPLGNLRKIIIPLPPLAEQQEIVAKIEELFSELDKGKEQLETARQQLKVYRQAVLKWAFEGKFTNLEVKEGELPEGWTTKRLIDVCSKIQDGSHFSPQIQFIEPGEDRFMYITAKNIRNNYMDLVKLIYIDREFHESIYSRCNPEFGDVLLTKDGVNTGEVTLNTLHEPFSLLSSVCIMKTRKEVLSNGFLKYFIQSPFGSAMINNSMTGTAIKRIVLRKIRDSEIITPPLEEQNQILQEIESRLSVCDKVEETIAQSLQQAETLRQSILKQAFEGKLVSSVLVEKPIAVS